MSDKGVSQTATQKPAATASSKRSGLVSSLVASFNQPEEPAFTPSSSARPKSYAPGTITPTKESSAASKSFASSTRAEHGPASSPRKEEPPKKEEPKKDSGKDDKKKDEPKKEEPKKDDHKKDDDKKHADDKKDEHRKDDKHDKHDDKKKDEHKKDDKHDKHDDKKKDERKKDDGKKHDDKKKKDDEEDDDDSSHKDHHKHHHKKSEKSSDGFQEPSKVPKHKKSGEGMESSSSNDSIASLDASDTPELTESPLRKTDDGSDDESKDDDEKSESSEVGNGKEKLSKRLGLAGKKKKGLFNSLTLKSWRKSKIVTEGQEGGDTPHNEEEEAQEPETPVGEGDAMDSPTTSFGRRSKHKSIFAKHGSKRDEENPPFEITRRASVASASEERTSSFIVKRPTVEGGSDAGEEGGSSLQHTNSMYSGRCSSCSPNSEDDEEGESIDKEEKMRRHVLRELMETEESYLNDLRIIVEVIIPSMKEKKVLDQTQINGIFSGVEVLRNFNNVLFKKLQSGEPVGKSFELMASFMKGYVQYCVNVPKAEEKLKQYSKDSSFRAFLTELSTHPEMHQLGVGDFLMKPVQRLCKYPLLLRELISHTPKDSPDYKSLNSAYQEIQKTVAAVNEGKRADEDHQKVITIFEKLEGFNDRAKFITPSRSYIHEETLRELLPNGTEQEMHYIFFNDLILRCKQHTGRYALKSFIPRDVLLVTPVTSPIEARKISSDKPMFLLDVVHAGVDKYTIICESEQDRTRILDIASGNSGNGSNNYTRSTKDLIDLYNLQPKTKVAPLASDEAEPPGTVVFSVLSSTTGDIMRYVSFDKDKQNWQDVINRINRKFGLDAKQTFKLTQHDKSDVLVKTVKDLCDVVKKVTSDPQFDMLLDYNVDSSDVK